MSNLSKSDQINQDLMRSILECQNVNQIVKMAIKLLKCQSNCQIVTISNVMYYQSVQINLAHRLCTDAHLTFSVTICPLSLAWVRETESCAVGENCQGGKNCPGSENYQRSEEESGLFFAFRLYG